MTKYTITKDDTIDQIRHLSETLSHDLGTDEVSTYNLIYVWLADNAEYEYDHA